MPTILGTVGTGGATVASSGSASHTIEAGTELVLICVAQRSTSNRTHDAVTVDGAPATKVVDVLNSGDCRVSWWAIEPAATGPVTIQTTLSGSATHTIHALNLSDVDLAQGISGAASLTGDSATGHAQDVAASSSISGTTAVGDLVLSAITTNPESGGLKTFTPGGGLAELSVHDQGSALRTAVGVLTADDTTETPSWTLSAADDLASAAVRVYASAAPALPLLVAADGDGTRQFSVVRDDAGSVTGLALGAITYLDGDGWAAAEISANDGTTAVVTVTCTKGALAPGTYRCQIPLVLAGTENDGDTLPISFVVG